MATNYEPNGKVAVDKRDSIIPAPPVSAFGDDEEDYRRVTKQQISDEKKAASGEKDETTNFGKATFSKAPKGVEELNVQSEIDRKSSVIEDSEHNGDVDSSEKSTEQSDQSEEQGHVSDPTGSWQRFAQTKFQVKASHSYCCAALQQPLLPKRDKSDHLASLATWVTILRIMGDLPEADYGENLAVAGQSKPIIQRVRDNYHHKYGKKEIEDAHRKYTDLFKDPLATELTAVPFLQDNRDTMLEKVQYVTSIGIYKADMRDELYCQVCKQLTNNPSRNSTVRGWVLLLIFAGSFSPSEKFASCFLQFLKDGPTEYAQRVERLLRRTFSVGTRGQPPSWLEFQAAKNAKPILVPVILMNGTRILIETDTATTVNELCSHVSERIGLADRSGFSIYVTLGNRIACLGHGLHRVMDAIGECEQSTKEMGMRESNSTWRLYFRKEFFTPWYEPGSDVQATDLTYQQIMRGVSVGEYKCDKEEVLIMMAAQRYYIENSSDTNKSKLEQFIKSWFPKEQRESKEMSYWCEKLKTEVENDFKDNPHKPSLKADIVTFAMNKWYNLFSRFYDASKCQGPGISWSNVVIGINCKGFNIMDESENVKVHLSFVEISHVSKGRQTMTVTTLQGEDYTASTLHNEDMFSLMTSFQIGLRRRSKYAIAVQDASHFESAIGFGLAKGDLVKLDKSYEEYGDSDVYTGTSVKNDKNGCIPRDVLYILPAIEEPKANVMGMLTVQLRKDNSGLTAHTPSSVAQPDSHTLQTYAKVYFRQASENAVTKLLSKASLKRKEKDVAWKFSRDTMKKPLLRKANHREDIRRAAVKSFLAIQRFMGDAPNKEEVSDTDMVNECVIEPAMRSRYVREEIFCQLMKQLTQNPDKSSEERGWQLFWLLSLCTYPNTELLEETEMFLKSHPNPIAKRCLTRLHRTKAEGCRYNPPHSLEHEALAKKHPSVEYSVMFPDQTKQKIEVDSSTKVSDIHKNICQKLQLKSPEEYGLFFGLRDKDNAIIINVKHGDYFFDYLTHIQSFYIQPVRTSTSTPGPSSAELPTPVLIFMKKLWLNVTPGLDKLADIKFHFPQEIPNYLRGYHKCSAEESVNLASFLFRAKYGDEKQPFDHIEDVIATLLPKSVLQSKSPEEWKKVLQSSISKHKFPTKEDGKVAFLKVLQKRPTYGSVFFEVKQRSSKTMPKQILVAVNGDGVSLIDSDTKDLLVTYSYDKVPNWAFDDRSFTLVIGESSGVSKIYMETSVGHNMDDIVMAYVAYIMNTQIKKKPSYAGIVVGESMC